MDMNVFQEIRTFHTVRYADCIDSGLSGYPSFIEGQISNFGPVGLAYGCHVFVDLGELIFNFFIGGWIRATYTRSIHLQLQSRPW